jgi:hypothetical protein
VVLKKQLHKTKLFQLKYKGVFMPRVRTGVAWLHAEGISAKCMPKILKIAAELLGGKLTESISRQDVTRFTSKAGILAQLQPMYDMTNTGCESALYACMHVHSSLTTKP